MKQKYLIWFLFFSTSPFLFGISYLLTLLFHIPPFVGLLFFMLIVLFFFRLMLGKIQPVNDSLLQKEISWMSVVLLILSLYLFVQKALPYITEHGGWDSWAIWTLQAKYLSNPASWQNLYLPDRHSHTDYPKGLSSTLGAVFYWLKSFHFKWALYIHFFYLLLTPLVLFFATAKSSFWLAIGALFLLYLQNLWVSQSVSGSADVILSFHVLGLFVALENYRKSSNPIFGTLTAVFAGLCLFTKNEAWLILGVACLLFGKLFLNKQFLITILATFLPFLIIYLWEHSFLQESNDLLRKISVETLDQLRHGERYNKIWDHFKFLIIEHFSNLRFLFLLSLLLPLLKRRWPHKVLCACILILLGYGAVYLLTPHDLDWQISTSMDRLLVQLVPLFLYGCMLSWAVYPSASKTIKQ